MAVIEENNKNVIFSSCYFSQGFYSNILILGYHKARMRHRKISKLNVLFNYVEIDQNYITESS